MQTATTFGTLCFNKNGLCARVQDGFYAVARVVGGKWELVEWAEMPVVPENFTKCFLVEWETIDID